MTNKLSLLNDNLFFNNNQIVKSQNQIYGIIKLLESVPGEVILPNKKYIKLINTIYGYHYKTNLDVDDLIELSDYIEYKAKMTSLLETIECYPNIIFTPNNVIINLEYNESIAFTIKISHYSNKSNKLNVILEDERFDEFRCNYYNINIYCSYLNYEIGKEYSRKIYSKFKILINAFEDLDIRISVLLSKSIFYVLIKHFDVIGSFARVFEYGDLENNNFEHKMIEMLSGIKNKDIKELITNTARLKHLQLKHF